MREDSDAIDPDSPEARLFLQDYQRRTMEEIRAAVTRGTAGIEASYLVDQGTLSLEREGVEA